MLLSNISAKGQPAPQDYRPLSVIKHIFCLYFASRSTHTFPNHSVLSLPQENLYRVHTKTLAPALSDSLSSSGRPFLCSPSYCTTSDYSVRRAFVVSDGRSCSHGNVLGVRWLLLDTSRENRPRGTTSLRLLVKERSRNHSRGAGIITAVVPGKFSPTVYRASGLAGHDLFELLLLSLPLN